VWEGGGAERPRDRREALEPAERRPAREPRSPRDLDDEAERREPLLRRSEPPRRASLPAAAEPELADEPVAPPRRSLFQRIFFYAKIALALALVGALSYFIATSDFDLSWLSASPSAASAQRAALYDAGPGSSASPVVGKATWRTSTRTSNASAKPETVITIEAQIPERSLAMTMTIGRDSEPDAGISHMFEIAFARPEQLPFGGITSVSRIVMKASETDPGDDLLGKNITVAPGNYLFALQQGSLQRNVELLSSRPWLGVLINFANGSAQMLNVEKGASGQKAVADALAKWAQ
jgi:hypothetical protein